MNESSSKAIEHLECNTTKISHIQQSLAESEEDPD